MEKVKHVSLSEGFTKLQLISLDACTRCYECLNWCPVYDVTEDESMTTPEKIRVFGNMVHAEGGLKAKLLGPPHIDPEALEKLSVALYTCTTCGVCGEVCPVGIHTQELWPAMRAKMVELGIGPIGGQKQAKQIVAEKHNPYDRPHEERFDWVPDDVTVAERAEVGYYAGCSGSYTAQPMMIGALRMMQAAGIEFTLFPDEWCCSFPLFVIGELSAAREMVRHNVQGYIERGVKKLVVSCPCCTFMTQKHWSKLLEEELPFEIVHITEVIGEKFDEGAVQLSKPLPRRITFHDACYLARGVRILDEPREVIGQFEGVDFVEMERNRELSKCCGSGGGIRRAYPELSIDMSINMIKDAEAVGADTLVLDCPACYERLHLANETYQSNIKIVDLMQLAAELL